jgi:hypothetical protein
MKNWQSTLAIGAMMSASFLAGQWLQSDRSVPSGPVFGPDALLAQGRGPANPPPVASTQPATIPPAVVYPEDSGQASSANGFLAVTGSYGVGTSVLYVIDTVNRQLAVYEARGGTESMRRIVLVGARKMDLDLMLEGYNDRSEYDYRKLRDVFESRGSGNPDMATGLDRAPTPEKSGGK